MDSFEFHPVTAGRWPDLAAFFEQHGNPNYCWCMRWRMRSGDYSAATAAERRERLRGMVEAGTPVGVLAYYDGRAVGWCSVGPRESYEALERSRVLRRLDEQPVWSVACFFVDPAFRGQGLAAKLLAAAVDYARDQGATLIEGYPVAPNESYRFMGAPGVFEAAGFEEAGRGARGRTIVRLATGDG